MIAVNFLAVRSPGAGLFDVRWAARLIILMIGLAGGLYLSTQLTWAAAPDDSPWQDEIVDTDNDIIVQSRTLAGKYTEFRGSTRLRTSLSSLVSLLRDVEHIPAWAYRTLLAMQLESISPREAIVYSVATLDWPFRDRDMVVRTRLHQDPVTLTVTVTGEALPDYLPLNPDYVRVPYMHSSWEFAPLGDGVVEVRFQGHGDIGGSLSDGLGQWFANMIIGEAPHKTLLGLRRAVQQPRYQQAEVTIIREPSASATAGNTQGSTNRLSMSLASSK
tara:strand:- start:329 stop:1150 length:822 start_codon:yes stop_codon:yes gene_type:complete